MNNVKFNSLPISERRQNEIRDARISLIKESRSRDEQIQNEIKKILFIRRDCNLKKSCK